MIEISVFIAIYLLSVELKSLIHSKIRGNKSPKYGLMDSLLIFEISDITFNMADTKAEVARSPSNFCIKQDNIEVEYDLARSGELLTNIFISLTASSFSLASLLYSSCEIRETISYLKYGRI